MSSGHSAYFIYFKLSFHHVPQMFILKKKGRWWPCQLRLGQDAKHCAVQLDLGRSVELMALHDKGNEWKYMEGMEA